MADSESFKFVQDALDDTLHAASTIPFFVYAEPEPSSKIVTITQLEFARAAHRAARCLRPVDSSAKSGDVVAILALSDTVLYQAVLVGLIRAGLVPFPISPRNSPLAVAKLLHKMDCRRVLATCVTLGPLLPGIKAELGKLDSQFVVEFEEMPLLAMIYPQIGSEGIDSPFEPYPSVYKPRPDDLCLVLHSSGSTGLPKAVPYKQKVVVQGANIGEVAEMRDHYPHPVAAMALPPFHIAGLTGFLLQPLYGNTPAAVYPPTASAPEQTPIFPTPDNILLYARRTGCQTLMIVPALLAIWVKSPEAVAYLSTYKLVGFAGGSLPPRLGKVFMDAGVKILSVYGATESGVISSIVPLPGDEKEWEWFRFLDRVQTRWIPQGDNTFECQILSTEQHEVCVENLDDIRGFATSDLFVRHPQKQHLWKVVGRTNEVIVHSSAEKTVPGPLEDIINSSPYVSAAIMFGRERDQAGILIEPSPNERIDVHNTDEVAGLRNKLWPIIEEANEIAPKFSRIFKEMILFSSTEKLLPRAGKGTVMREAALKEYAPEIDAIYETVAASSNIASSIKLPNKWESAEVSAWLVGLAKGLGGVEEGITLDVDVFRQGFDSLAATIFRRRIVSALRSGDDASLRNVADGLTQNLVYTYPTIQQLSSFLTRLRFGLDVPFVERAETVVEICAGTREDTTPTIILPGASGNVRKFFALRKHCQGRVWAIQVTENTPLDSLTGMVEYWKQKIVEKQPRGPYRIAAFSASCIHGVVLAKLLEDAGEKVAQLIFFDYSPALCLQDEPLLRARDAEKFSEAFLEQVIRLMQRDPALNEEAVANYVAARQDLPDVPEISRRDMRFTRTFILCWFEFLRGFYSSETPEAFVENFTRWMISVKAPTLTVVVELGMVLGETSWADLGASQLGEKASVQYLTGVGHFGMFTDPEVARILDSVE